MTHDEHQMERMRHWSAVQVSVIDTPAPNLIADHLLAEFDTRFPAPAPAPEAVEVANVYTSIDGAELESLRQKACYWDAVASGKVVLAWQSASTCFCTWLSKESGIARTVICNTSAEAVEAAIAAGALE